MDTVSIKQLRDNLAQIIEEVAIGGKRIEVTKFGKSKAFIVPIEAIQSQKKHVKQVDWTDLPAFGMWKNRKDMKDSAKWVEDLRTRESFRIQSK